MRNSSEGVEDLFFLTSDGPVSIRKKTMPGTDSER